jgi:hypothetical protein
MRTSKLGGSIMERTAISYQGEALEAWEDEVGWTVRLGGFEASSRYLDLALAELLGDELVTGGRRPSEQTLDPLADLHVTSMDQSLTHMHPWTS